MQREREKKKKKKVFSLFGECRMAKKKNEKHSFLSTLKIAIREFTSHAAAGAGALFANVANEKVSPSLGECVTHNFLLLSLKLFKI
jgi:hypothetical protein